MTSGCICPSKGGGWVQDITVLGWFGGLIPSGGLLEVWTALVLLGISRQLRGYQVSLWVLVQGSIQISTRFRTHPFGKTEMVQRNSSFPGGIGFQDCKVSLGILLLLGYHMNWRGNYWMDSVVLDLHGVSLQTVVLQLQRKLLGLK